MTKKEKCELWKKKLSEYYAGLKPIAKDLEEQKQEIKLEDVFNDEKKQGVKELIDKHKQDDDNLFNYEKYRAGFIEGAKWQQEQDKDVYLNGYVDGSRAQAKLMYSEEEVRKAQQAILGNIRDAMQDENYIIEYLKNK